MFTIELEVHRLLPVSRCWHTASIGSQPEGKPFAPCSFHQRKWYNCQYWHVNNNQWLAETITITFVISNGDMEGRRCLLLWPPVELKYYFLPGGFSCPLLSDVTSDLLKKFNFHPCTLAASPSNSIVQEQEKMTYFYSTQIQMYSFFRLKYTFEIVTLIFCSFLSKKRRQHKMLS